MPVWLIVVLALVVALAVLAIGGAIANGRRERSTRGPFERRLGAVDRALAAALADDRGWDPSQLEAAARRGIAANRPQAQITELELVQVIDRPGTDDDEALFRAQTAQGVLNVRLERRGGEWHAAAVEPGLSA
jgi:hypothetical protein